MSTPRRALLLTAAVLLALLATSAAHAQSQGDACSVAGKVYSIDTPGVPALHCESGTLQNFFIPKENAALSCTAAREGALQYIAATDTWNFCNGTAWTALASGGSIAINDLTDAFTDYAVEYNFIMGRAGTAALTAGAMANTFIGFNAGATTANSTISTQWNTAVGAEALTSLSSAAYNTAVGALALTATSTGGGNTALGGWTMLLNTTGSGNTGLGAFALYNNKAKSKNTAVGYYAMNYADDTTTASDGNNTALGYFALRGGTTAANNTGTQNTALGAYAMLATTSGSNNVAVGYNAGNTTTTGGSNIFIGSGIVAPAATTSNHLNIGNTIYGNLSTDNVGIGTASPTYMLSLEGDTANRTIGMERETTAATAGRALTLLSGGAVSGGTNLAGGDLTLSGGTATGTGTSKILFSGAGYGSSGTADRAPAEVGRISGGGYMQFTGTFGSGDTMAQGGGSATPGAGARMVWYPRKAAFRAGYVSGSQWDDANVGNHSVALGNSNIASGLYSTAMGVGTTASNQASLATGILTTASGLNSTAMGNSTVASGDNSTAMGVVTSARGNYSTAIGRSTTASGDYSTAMGRHVTAGNGTALTGFGDGSMALGLIDDAVTITTPSEVHGIQSMGIFMGDQDGLVQTGDNTLALYGGKMIIDSAVPATYMAAPTYNLSFSGDTAAQTIGMERETTAATAGRNLTISSGGAVSGGTDLAGGNLVLQSGIATGNGASSILFQTVHSGQGAGTTDRSPATSMTLDSIRLVISPPASEAVAGAAVITADACGTIKQITSTGNVTTNTTDTFTSPTASYAGCCMDVVNVDTADTITLDANAKFKTIGGADQALGPDDTVRVCSNGTNWYQVGAVAGNQ